MLKRRNAEDELTALARDLVATDRKRPEAWLAVAAKFDCAGDRDAALQFVDKAIALRCEARLAFRLRGELLLAQGKAEHSIVAYFQANNVAKDLASYRGLVLAYLSTRKYKEALCTAKEAVATLPRNAKAIALVGRVLATSPEGADKARRAFQKALQLDASCADAALALADLHAQRGECDAAAELLTRALSENEQDVLHAKLGDVYVIAGEERYPEALASYHAALSLNPASDAALTGLDRLEKLMAGVDPDLSDEHDSCGDDDDDAPDTANSAHDVEEDALESAAYLCSRCVNIQVILQSDEHASINRWRSGSDHCDNSRASSSSSMSQHRRSARESAAARNWARRATGTFRASHASNSPATSTHAPRRVSQVRFGGAGPGG